MIDTKHAQTGAFQLTYNPSAGTFEKSPGTRTELGTTVRWIFSAGLEESTHARLERLTKAVPEKQLLVINSWVVEQKDWLEELIRKIPSDFKSQVLLFGKSFEVQQLADYYGIPMVPSDDVEDLAIQLMQRPEEGNLQVRYLGDPITVKALYDLLPPSIQVTPIPLDVGLRELFLALGVPGAVLDAVRVEELEKVLARERAA